MCISQNHKNLDISKTKRKGYFIVKNNFKAEVTFKNFVKFTERHLWLSLLFNKVAG